MPNANHWNSKTQRKQRPIFLLSISFTWKRLRTSIQGRTYYKMKNDFHVADVMENISLFVFIDTLIYHARALTVVVYSAVISACFQILKNDHKIDLSLCACCIIWLPYGYIKHILTAIYFVHQLICVPCRVFTTWKIYLFFFKWITGRAPLDKVQFLRWYLLHSPLSLGVLSLQWYKSYITARRLARAARQLWNNERIIYIYNI